MHTLSCNWSATIAVCVTVGGDSCSILQRLSVVADGLYGDSIFNECIFIALMHLVIILL